MARDLPREVDVLIGCARVQMDAETATRIRRVLADDLDWSSLIRMAHQHKVLPLVYWHLNAVCPDAVPRDIRERLRDAFYVNVHRNLYLANAVVGLLRLLEGLQIPAIPFKGVVLAQSAYGSPVFRHCGDLDIFVHQRDVPHIRRVLRTHGYRLRFPPTKSDAEAALLAAWSDAQEAAYLTLVDAQHFTNDDTGIEVDLHWSLAPRWFLSLDHHGMRQRLQTVRLCDTEVPTLNPEDLLLVLCVEGTKDGWSRLQRVCDVATLVQTQPGLDWDRMLRQARARGGERMLLLGLCLANTVLGTPMPAAVIQRWQTDRVTLTLASQARAWLLPKSDHTYSGPPSFHHLSVYHLQAHDRLRDKIRFCRHRAFTPSHRDWTFLRLPPSLAFLYYVLRPLRLLAMCGTVTACQLVEKIVTATSKLRRRVKTTRWRRRG